MNPDQVKAVLTAVAADIPKVKEFLTDVNNHPVIMGFVEREFPNVTALIPLAQKLEPYLDFLQQLDAAILKALQAA